MTTTDNTTNQPNGLVDSNQAQSLANIRQAVSMLMYVDLEEIDTQAAMGVFHCLAEIRDALEHESIRAEVKL